MTTRRSEPRALRAGLSTWPAVSGDTGAARDWAARARVACEVIADPAEREVIEGDLATLALA